jgi:polysaccharide pyruvyl transferase WcaK-like protein
MKRVFLVNDTSDQSNWGCKATSQALSALIAHAGGEIAGRVYLGRLFGRTVFGRPIMPGASFARSALWAVVRRVLPDQAPRNAAELNRIVERALAGSGPLAQDVSTLRGCDVMLINGEGSIYGRQRMGLMLFAYIRLAKTLGVKVALVNHTASFSDGAMLALAREVIHDLDDLVAREPATAQEWSAKIPGSHADVAADAAFTTVPMDRAQLAQYCTGAAGMVSPGGAGPFDPDKPYVCVGGSSFFRRPDFGNVDPLRGYLALCDELRAPAGQVLLVIADGQDRRFLLPVAKALDLPVAQIGVPTAAAAGLLAHADLLVSGRWHPSILATIGGTPCIMIEGNTHKCRAMAEQFGFPFFDGLSFNARAGALIGEAQRMIAQGPALREKTKAIAEACRAQTPRHVRIVSA